MADGSAKFDRAKVRILGDAESDPAASLFDQQGDIDWLLLFLESFRRLGWLPPDTLERQQMLANNDVVRHDRAGAAFYEFRSRGPKDDREPPLTLFFHLDPKKAVVRIIGFRLTAEPRRRRPATLDAMARRAAKVDMMLANEE